MITVRCDSRNRRQISVSEKLGAFVPLKYWVCHIDDESVLFDGSGSCGKFRGKLLVGSAEGVVVVEEARISEACESSSDLEVLSRYSSDGGVKRSSFRRCLCHAQQETAVETSIDKRSSF